MLSTQETEWGVWHSQNEDDAVAKCFWYDNENLYIRVKLDESNQKYLFYNTS